MHFEKSVLFTNVIRESRAVKYAVANLGGNCPLT